MRDEEKTKEQLIDELIELRARVSRLETLEAERKHTEETLRENKGECRTILEGIEDGYFEVDLNGNFIFFT